MRQLSACIRAWSDGFYVNVNGIGNGCLRWENVSLSGPREQLLVVDTTAYHMLVLCCNCCYSGAVAEDGLIRHPIQSLLPESSLYVCRRIVVVR
jgi:hypothetical protein